MWLQRDRLWPMATVAYVARVAVMAAAAVTPGLVVEGEIRSVGKVLSEAEITTLLTSAMS